MKKGVHIISFQFPYPPIYGGIIDVYYKIKALQNNAIQVHLHVFTEKKKSTLSPLEDLGCKVSTYPYKKPLLALAINKPLSVYRRYSKELIKNLLKDNAPILAEGLQCTSFYLSPEFKDRKLAVRMHNIEHEYYYNLSLSEIKIWKKLYLKQESKRLKKYEQEILTNHFDNLSIFSISPNDNSYFKKQYPDLSTHLVMPFHKKEPISISKSKGGYILYHGNLSLSENQAVVEKLCKIASSFNAPLWIAGKDCPPDLEKKILTANNIKLIKNPTNRDMEKYMKDAHIHLIPSMQPAGIKLKYVQALHTARYILANSNSVFCKEDLPSSIIIEDDFSMYSKIANKLLKQSIDEKLILERKKYVQDNFNEEIQIQPILNWLGNS